ncbi:MAG: hypothetical protein M1115_09970 [Actinobacteria bacterium]|nr:hypothetical protein [Actinomycetota bacterium]
MDGEPTGAGELGRTWRAGRHEIPGRACRHGVVTHFDGPRGLGIIRAEPGWDLPFHCVAVADGSRNAQVGALVTFTLRAGPDGRYEAWSIVPQGTVEPGAPWHT